MRTAISSCCAAIQDELDLLAKDLLINVTSFFRDPKVFELLAKKIIPDLVRRHARTSRSASGSPAAAPARRPIRSPCCSSRRSPRRSATIKLQVFASDVDRGRGGQRP